ncbi:MAG TPA: tetratricopeptide repeat protein [Candidatus Manganitrophaceae bacterium]|nr:tetratricopeptide repeat protein [Candidatus Manganitrophaceae bacterium]
MKKIAVLFVVSTLLVGCQATQRVFSSRGEATPAEPKNITEAAQEEFNEGVKAYRNEQYVNAQKHFENVTKIEPDLPEAHLNLALSLYQQGKTDQAKKHYDDAGNLFAKEFEGRGTAGPAPRG